MMRKIELLAACWRWRPCPALADAGDPPVARSAAELQSGTVSFRPGTVEDWTAAR